MRFLLFFMAFIYTGSICTAQFTATMKNVVSGQERIYQVYSDGENYRYDFVEDGINGIVIVEPLKSKTAILMPDKKYVHYTETSSVESRSNDPVQAVMTIKDRYDEKKLEEEEIAGFTCLKSELLAGDQKVFTLWFSQELNFPLRIENNFGKDTYMELSGIKIRDIDAKKFVVPNGFTEVDDRMRPIIPEPPAPESWTSRSVVLPFDGVLKRGEKIKMDILVEGHYKIKVRNEGDTPTKYIYHLYENGEKIGWERVGNDDRRTHRLFMEEKRTFTYAWEEGWQLIVEGYEGEVMMEVFAE